MGDAEQPDVAAGQPGAVLLEQGRIAFEAAGADARWAGRAAAEVAARHTEQPA